MGKNRRHKHAPGSLLSGLPTSVLNSICGVAAESKESVTFSNERKKRSASPESQLQAPPAKKHKTGGLLGPGWEAFDATHLVPFYQAQEDVPNHLKKYFYQRERYFSLYHEGCLLDEEGWYSVTPEAIADVIAEKCRCDTILDAFCGVGGNAIAFARTCERVIAMDISETRLRLARHNAVLYGVQDRIEFILGDYVSFAEAFNTCPDRVRTGIDVVFLSPPWGGIDYTYSPQKQSSAKGDKADTADPAFYDLDRIKPLGGAGLFRLTRRITPHVAFYLPKHVNIEQISQLVPESSPIETSGEANVSREGEMIEVQEAWMGTKLKAVTCYFGGLVEGQGDMFSRN